MAICDAKKAAESLILSGFRHHDPEEETLLIEHYLTGGAEEELLSIQALRHYAALVQALETKAYTQPVAKSIRFMQANLYGRCTVEAAASHAGLNPQYFSGLFKRETGLPPSQYIREKKLDEAARLLRQGKHLVFEIAEMLGFSSSSHFERAFKDKFGMTAKQFAKAEGVRPR